VKERNQKDNSDVFQELIQKWVGQGRRRYSLGEVEAIDFTQQVLKFIRQKVN